MMKMDLKFKPLSLLIALFTTIGFSAIAQIEDPVEWTFSVESIDDQTFEVIGEAKIEAKWHVYSSVVSDDPDFIGPVPTDIYFLDSANVVPAGAIAEGEYITHYDPNFDADLNYFENEARFSRRFSISEGASGEAEGELSYMACDDSKCIFPEPVYLTAGFEDGKLAYFKVDEEVIFGEASASNSSGGSSGVYEPAKWSMKSIDEGGGLYTIEMTCTLDEGWHLYSQKLESDMGPVPTRFTFQLPDGHTLDGDVAEGTPKKEYDPNFMMDLSFFEGSPVFRQQVQVSGDPDKVVAGVDFMVCNDEMCLPPELQEFTVDLASGVGQPLSLDAEPGAGAINALIPPLAIDLANPQGECGEVKSYDSAWTVFIFGFLGGLLALLTPCVFPMIPLTVSFFTKGGQDTKSGIGKALLYGFFIFLIYAILSVPFHFGTNPEALNEIATSPALNIGFFAIFVIFAISFFGFFEIRLPNALLNKADNASNVGGVAGIFFMALTLALVSFSCTGPILGTVLGNSLKNGPWPITAAMSGFGIALGLPFAIFAAFPSMMKSLPKSGGWLNTVKVVLGFLELALAVKFLSNADLVYQWHLIERETFFLIWVIIGAAMVLYLIGMIRFPHDSPLKRLGVGRIAFTALILAFTVYLFPGVLKESPWRHDLLAGFPPPTFYSWYERDTFHAEFDDFDEAMAYAKEQNKPLLVDFTGWACVNCRQMEETVWTDEEIKQILEEDFVLVSLYVDDKVELPEEKQGVYTFEVNGEEKKKRIRTIGNKWATFQTHIFNNNSQPYYVMLSNDGELLGNPVGYTPEVETYKTYLECGLETNQRLSAKAEDANTQSSAVWAE
jgi:thiol:disulfide interchange protein DsbD